MKKSFPIFIIIILVADISFAQSLSTANQSDPGIQAVASQIYSNLKISKIQQVSDTLSSMNTRVTQNCNSNSSKVNMSELGSQSSTVFQNGSGNQVTVLHLGSSNTSDVLQHSDHNLADLKINAGGTSASILQYSSGNQAKIDIGTNGNPMGSNNSFLVVQTLGDGNKSLQTMTASGFNFVDNNNHGDIQVFGINNITNQTIGLDPASAFVCDNFEYMFILGDLNTVNQTQYGRGNYSNVGIGTSYIVNGLSNNNNTVITIQQSDGHSSLINILGNGNAASVIQSY